MGQSNRKYAQILSINQRWDKVGLWTKTCCFNGSKSSQIERREWGNDKNIWLKFTDSLFQAAKAAHSVFLPWLKKIKQLDLLKTISKNIIVLLGKSGMKYFKNRTILKSSIIIKISGLLLRSGVVIGIGTYMPLSGAPPGGEPWVGLASSVRKCFWIDLFCRFNSSSRKVEDPERKSKGSCPCFSHDL